MVRLTARWSTPTARYAIDGCAGVKYYQTKDAALTDSAFPRAAKIVDATAPVFSAISIDGDNLYYTDEKSSYGIIDIP